MQNDESTELSITKKITMSHVDKNKLDFSWELGKNMSIIWDTDMKS